MEDLGSVGDAATAVRNERDLATLAAMLGFAVMMTLDVAFK